MAEVASQEVSVARAIRSGGHSHLATLAVERAARGGHTMSESEVAVYRQLRREEELSVRVLTCIEAETYGMP